MMRTIGLVPALLGLTLVTAPFVAGTVVPVYGPENFELIQDTVESFAATFEIEVGGEYVLYLRNGDGQTARVAAASVTLNGGTIVVSEEVDEATRALKRPVLLVAGTNQLALELEGEAGSFVTAVIAEPGPPPVFVSGRLVLPWGRDAEDHLLRLALKNDSKNGPRVFKAVFLAPNGQPVAQSLKMPIPPRGSVAFPVQEIIAEGAWQIGSIEISYTGPGKGRLFGMARQIDLATVPLSEALPLVQAGFSVSEPKPQVQDGRHRPAF